MTTLGADPNIVGDAVARLTDLYRDKPVTRALAEVLAERFAHEDEVELELYERQWLDSATGELLDACGEVVGEPRSGRSDDLFRVWIRARIRINRTQGKISDSYRLVRLIAGGGATVRYEPTPPAAYLMHVEGTDVDPIELYKLLDAVRPAGVQMNLVYTPNGETENIFTLSDTGSTESGDSDEGLGDSGNPAVGGRLRGVL